VVVLEVTSSHLAVVLLRSQYVVQDAEASSGSVRNSRGDLVGYSRGGGGVVNPAGGGGGGGLHILPCLGRGGGCGGGGSILPGGLSGGSGGRKGDEGSSDEGLHFDYCRGVLFCWLSE
jgi:hypothetical protein